MSNCSTPLRFGKATANEMVEMAERRMPVGGREGRIDINSLVEKVYRFLRFSFRVYPRMWQGAKIEIISVQAFGSFSPGSLDLGLLDRWVDRGNYTFGDTVLQVEKVGRSSIVLFGPEMI